jgi:hypothetical protein
MQLEKVRSAKWREIEENLFPSGSEVIASGNGSGIRMGLRWTSASHFSFTHRFSSLFFFLPLLCFLTLVVKL